MLSLEELHSIENVKGAIEVYASGLESNSAHKLLFYDANPDA
jgi:hypothetical protein